MQRNSRGKEMRENSARRSPKPDLRSVPAKPLHERWEPAASFSSGDEQSLANEQHRLQQELAASILRLLNRGRGDTEVLIGEMLRLIRESIGFDAVGLRIRRGNDFPYYEHRGFSDEFLYEENFLCARMHDGSILRDENGQAVLECTCGLVLSGKTDPNKQFFTRGGSFWTNHSSELLQIPPEDDPRKNPRNRCIQSGYQSVALIPVRSGQEIIGLLQLNDRREGRLSPEMIRFFESLDDQIGLTFKRKQAQEALAQERDILRSVMNGAKNSHLVYLDSDFNFVHVNETYARSCGFRSEEMIGRNYFDLYPSEENKEIFERVRDTGESVIFHDKPFEYPDQPERGITYWDWTLIPVKEATGNVAGLVFSLYETTESKRTEMELKSLNETLEHRVAERSAEAERRAEQLRQLALELTLAEQRERQRLAQVMHDGLQQMLVGAKYRLALIERSSDKKKAAAEVVDIIDDAIETSRSLTAELSPPILLQSGLNAALEWLARWMQNKHGLSVDLTASENIPRLQEELAVVLFHAARELLFNVIKHAGVSVANICVKRENDQIKVTVEDKGKGFDRFQLRTEGGSAGGFGLFNISERLIMLGGRMTIDSSPRKGSRISLFAPLSGTKPGSAVSPAGYRPRASAANPVDLASGQAVRENKIRIVLVDDHIVMRQGLAALLRAEPDMDIAGQAADGMSAADLIREVRPDVVLMDIDMPGINGIRATQIIHEELPEIRIIGLSMFKEGKQAVSMRKAGAVAYLSKSGSSEDLIATIRRCIQPSDQIQRP